jgi:hypothetical protein
VAARTPASVAAVLASGIAQAPPCTTSAGRRAGGSGAGRVISDCHKILGPIVTFGDRLSRLSVPIVTAIVTGVFH